MQKINSEKSTPTHLKKNKLETNDRGKIKARCELLKLISPK